jgi:hypothetical protein
MGLSRQRGVSGAGISCGDPTFGETEEGFRTLLKNRINCSSEGQADQGIGAPSSGAFMFFQRAVCQA